MSLLASRYVSELYYHANLAPIANPAATSLKKIKSSLSSNHFTWRMDFELLIQTRKAKSFCRYGSESFHTENLVAIANAAALRPLKYKIIVTICACLRSAIRRWMVILNKILCSDPTRPSTLSGGWMMLSRCRRTCSSGYGIRRMTSLV